MARVIETLSLFALLVVVAVRPLIGESYDSAGSPFTAAIEQLSDPLPVRTLVLDAIILLSALTCALARWRDGREPYRRTGLEIGFVVLVFAGVVSCIFAGNKRLAINGTIDWLCLPILAMALAQLLDRPGRRTLLLSVILASAVVQGFQCFEQRLSFDETWTRYVSMREEFWGRQNVPLDSPRVEAFERRIQSREASGFLPHANVTGSYFVLCLLPALGLVMARWRSARSTIGYAAMAATAGLAAWFCVGVALTKSFGAIVAGAAGIGTWALLVTFRAWISAHRRRALMLGWSLAALGVFGVIGYGVAFDRLPGWSLTFRWQYWTASAGMIADHGLTGVGRENFGRHYLRYKSIESPEEVSNPHNLFVQAAAEWGLLGLVGLVVMLVGGSAKILTAVTNAESEIRSRDGPDKAEAIPPFRWGSWWAAILASLLAVRFVLMETDDYNFVYYVSVASGIVWSIGFFGVVMGESGAGEFGNMFRTLKPAVAAGLGAFLLHDMINFASFVPGSATTAFALAALVIAGPIDKASGYTGATRSFGIFAACCAAGLVIVSIAGLAPVFRAWKYVVLADLKQTIYVDDGNGGAWLFYKQAAAADPLDPTPCVKEAEWLMRTISIGQAGPSAWTGAEAAIHEAIARDPFSHSLRRMKMRFYVERAQDLGDLADRMQAIEAAREALAVYPENPEGLIAFADRQREAAEAMLAGGVSVGDAGVEAFRLIDEAIGNFRSALALDGRRLSWEELHRIRMSERVRIQQIEAELVRLRESLEDR